MKKIIHIITGLGSGGAENMLYKLLRYSDKNMYYHEVISLMDEGVIGERIKELGVTVHTLNLDKKNLIKALLKGKKLCKDFDIINTWLYHADLFGFLIAKLMLNKKLIWNIRHSNLDKSANKSRTIKITKLNSFLSNYVDCITYNSNKAYKTHREVGYADKRSIVIPNGFELDRFNFSSEKRSILRQELSLNEEEKVIITVGRWNIQKDYFTLLKCLSEIKTRKFNFKMIMVGSNLDYSNNDLNNLINNYNLKDEIILLGRRTDIPDLLSAADIYVSSSLGESFSNSIGEAMACKLPCIVTDVGDSKIIVGNTGETVKAQDYLDMSNKLIKYLTEVNLTIKGEEARTKVLNDYEIKTVVKLYEDVYN